VGDDWVLGNVWLTRARLTAVGFSPDFSWSKGKNDRSGEAAMGVRGVVLAGNKRVSAWGIREGMVSEAGRGNDRTVDRAIDRPICSAVDGLFSPIVERTVELTVELAAEFREVLTEVAFVVSRTVTASVVEGENSGGRLAFVSDGSKSWD